MKWNNFVRVFNENRWLQMHIGSPSLVSLPLNVPADEARRQLKEYVESNLDYIAFRPFEQLDLATRNHEEFEKIPHPRSSNLACYRGSRIDYIIRFHIEGGVDEAYERARHIDTDINAALTSLIEWHKEGWGKKGCAIRFGFIVKRTRYSNEAVGFCRERLEVFPFPAAFTLEPIQAKEAA